jgi:hypothetical protein
MSRLVPRVLPRNARTRGSRLACRATTCCGTVSRPFHSSPTSIFLVLGLATLAACTSGEKLYRVSGVVTYDGKPVAKGVIHFDPKADGPAGFANILDGKYDTAKEGKGVRGGSYDVRVNGFDGKEANEAPFGRALFPEYTATKELPRADSTYDLDVPKGR